MSTASRSGDSAADDDNPTGAETSAPVGPRIFGGVMFALGLFLLWEAYAEVGDDELALDSPRVAPLAVTAMWVLFSGVYFARQLFWPGRDYRKVNGDNAATAATGAPTVVEETAAEVKTDETKTDDTPDTAETPDAADTETEAGPAEEIEVADHTPTRIAWLTPVLLTALLVAYAFALDPLGFLISTFVFFVGAAWILGSKNLLRDTIAGLLLTFAIYYGMSGILDISLPSGVLPL